MFRNNTEIQILGIVVYIINGLQNELNRVETDSRERGIKCGVKYFRTTLWSGQHFSFY